MEGTKHDGGKIRYDLLPPEFLEGTAEILTFGAAKYTQEWEYIWDELLNVQEVKKIVISTARGCVVSATKNNSEKVTLSMPNGKEKIVKIGGNAIQNGLNNTPNAGKLIQILVEGMQELNSWPSYESLDLQKKDTDNSISKAVLSAEVPTTLTLTIVTRLGNLEVSCAPDAITDSGFWETIWKDLKEQYAILRPLRITGDRNWEKGINFSRVFGALMRHLWAWWNPYYLDTDEETGKSHLWHAACCLAFLISYEARGMHDFDDRPTI